MAVYTNATTSYVDALNNVLPAGHGYITWSMDPAVATSNSAPTTGVVTLVRVRVGASTSVSNTVVWQAVAGASVTNAYFGLYDSSGSQLGVSTDQSSNLVGTGARTVALSGAPLSLAAGYYYVAILIGAATTVPQFSRSASSGIVNVGLAAPNLRFATSGTGLTALPSSITMSGITGVSIGYWAALS